MLPGCYQNKYCQPVIPKAIKLVLATMIYGKGPYFLHILAMTTKTKITKCHRIEKAHIKKWASNLPTDIRMDDFGKNNCFGCSPSETYRSTGNDQGL